MVENSGIMQNSQEDGRMVVIHQKIICEYRIFENFKHLVVGKWLAINSHHMRNVLKYYWKSSRRVLGSDYRFNHDIKYPRSYNKPYLTRWRRRNYISLARFENSLRNAEFRVQKLQEWNKLNTWEIHVVRHRLKIKEIWRKSYFWVKKNSWKYTHYLLARKGRVRWVRQLDQVEQGEYGK